ncbi:MAG: HAMP domain-containing sensor histidine kinase [Pseudomonadales bacterium]|nr:HAMP domain-containing sensor histidine kinase [Pseudomonadales bacterium]
MLLLTPRSILQLTLIGFLAVTGLLIISLLVTAGQLDRLSERSRLVVSQVASAMGASRTLVEQTTSMERHARQYAVLKNPEILELYADRRKNFEAAALRLSALNLQENLNENILGLQALERAASARIDGAFDAELYPELLRIGYQISDSVNQWAEAQVEDIRLATERTQRLLSLEAIFLVSAALVLSGIFTALITRPLLQIERAIGRLGRGEYQNPVIVNGPRDLVNLGQRLDWLRSRLTKLEQQRTSFLRHVSHELKTPLASIKESTALLRDGVVGGLNTEQQDILRIQESNSQRLIRLIDDLLRHNADSFSVLSTEPETIRLDQLVEEVVACHELAIKSGKLVVNCELARTTVVGDREQLRVAIDNLMTNAVRYSPEKGIITIRLGCSQEGATAFEIQDQGPGIREQEMEKIFEAFYQGSTPAREAYPGSGLGLAISREYIQANGGQIDVINCETGACFRVLFPTNPLQNKKNPE